jgi:hypothetical protein
MFNKKRVKIFIVGSGSILLIAVFLVSILNRLTIGSWNPFYVPEGYHFEMLRGRFLHVLGIRPAVQRFVVWEGELEIVCSPKYQLIDSMKVIANPDVHMRNHHQRGLIWMANEIKPEVKMDMLDLLHRYHFTEIQAMVKDLTDSADLYENILLIDHQMDDAFAAFAYHYWDDFFAIYYSMISSLVCSSAETLAESLSSDNAPLLQQMEIISGLRFPKKAKITAYPSLFISPSASAHLTETEYVIVYPGTITDPHRFFDPVIHELTHFLVKPEIGKMLPTLGPILMQDKDFLVRWSQSEDDYDWEGWLEENVVNALEQVIGVRLGITNIKDADDYLSTISPFSKKLFYELLEKLPEESGEGQVVSIVLDLARRGDY